MITDFGRNSFVEVKGLKERIREAEKEIQMRKYRGLTKDSKWMYGFFIVQTTGVAAIYRNGYFTDVILETVGQQIGLKDKNGTEIYEGDCFRTSGKHGYSSNCIVEVLFVDGAFVADLHRKDLLEVSAQLLPHYKEEYPDSFEIIGNIHQNPELMEQG